MKAAVLGVIILARNGDRTIFHQDPYSYEPSFTESTPLGAVESFQLGSYLRSIYLDSSSPLHIENMPLDPTHPIPPSQVHVHAKASGEGAAIFDSSIALLQGMFPPTPLNQIKLANGSTIRAPLGGYQYVPVEMVPDTSDNVLESWIGCAAFEKHTTAVYNSEVFKQKAKEAQHFFDAIHDYTFGLPTSLENMWNVYDYLNTELVHNQTFAFRLPPTLIEQARGWVDYHEDAVFSDRETGGIGNVAGRTILHPILTSLERIAFEDDPLRIMLIETSYQPFISLFHMLDVLNERPDLAGIPDYASALSFELIRGPAPELRDFVRIKFKNGTEGEFQELSAFGHDDAVPVTEFIYRLEHSAISNTKQWNAVCGNSRWISFGTTALSMVTSAQIPTPTMETLTWMTLLALVIYSIAVFLWSVAVRRHEHEREHEHEHENQNQSYSTFVNEKYGSFP